MSPNRDDPARLRRRLLAWFDRHRRPMPWREDPAPYRVWISEIMLQQTQVATVIPYFERFTARFPDLASLAAAAEEDVLAAWSGLGYYRRARDLHRAARQVAAAGGRLPREAADWERLPGVGRYTAGAVASIAFGRPAPALDGNGVRVLCRLHALAGDPARQPLRGRLWDLLGELAAGARPGDVNQAVMELGARVCRPGAADCAACPLADGCRARAAGDPLTWPERTPGAAPLVLRLQVALCRDGGAVLLSRGERPFLGGLWNLPYRVLDGAGALRREGWAGLGLRLRGARRLGTLTHGHTRYRLEQEVVAARAELLAREGAPEYRWAGPRERARLGLPAFATKALARFGDQ
jgi:A/G-specific adenine glycosylase